MNIAIIMEYHIESQMGGAELQCHYLAEKFCASGHNVSYYAIRGHQGSTEKASIYGYKIVQFADNNLISKFFFIYQELKKQQVEVIYIRTINYLCLASALARMLRCKCVYGISSIIQCDKLKIRLWSGGIRKSVRYFKKAIIHNFNVNFYHLPDRIVAQTDEQRNILETRRKINSIVIYNGHPISSNKEFIKTLNPIEVVWVGKESAPKRLDYFIRLIEQSNTGNVKFIIACIFRDKLTEHQVREKIKHMEHVQLFSNIPVARVIDIFQSASLLVNTSLIEGFSNTFIQAWLEEVPILSYSNDPDGLITRHKIGFCAGGSWDTFVKQFERLISDRALLGEMGRRARSFAVSAFDIEQNARILEKKMQELVSGD